MFNRILMMDLPAKQSTFLWGARQTGKSTYLKHTFPNAVHFDLLKSELFNRYLTQPHLFREDCLQNAATRTYPVIVDEVQKIPQLLNEVHWLIENENMQFILCGSSSRQLKQHGVNMLGGRAWCYHFFPLVSAEIPEFNLLKALNHGLVPNHYLSSQPKKTHQAYVHNYLREEIQLEGLVRNLPSFSKFLDSLAFSHGELTKYSNIAQDCGVDAKTVQNYYQILIDTLLGYYVLPYTKTIKRDILTKIPKFYLFDVGIANFLAKTVITDLHGAAAGKAFEHFIFMELYAFNQLMDKELPITYWRTKSGLEVDFILGSGEVAIEVKMTTNVKKADIKGLMAFVAEHCPGRAIVVSQDPIPRQLTTDLETPIEILPWQDFLKALWAGKIF